VAAPANRYQEIDAMFYIKPKDEYVAQAIRMIENFERGTFGGGGRQAAFKMEVSSIARGLRERVNDPTKIDQNQGSLCGPAAFFYCLLNTRPHLYTGYVIDLYYDGIGMINDLVVRPREQCRAFTPRPDQIADVDWIALASLRDSSNSDLSYSTTDKEFAGITMPHDMVSWFTKAGFAGVTDKTNISTGKRIDTLLEASNQLRASRFVCLFVNANIIDYVHFSDYSRLPNHWVVLDQPMSTSEPAGLKFSVYSYGKIMDAPPSRSYLSQGNLPKYFFGYVSAVPY
jgi:hypothetical protein